MYTATVLSSEVVNFSYISYNLKYENLPKEVVTGTPLFSFGYNSYRYPDDCKVGVLVLNEDFFNPVILGRLYDTSVVPTSREGVPREGELLLNSGFNNNSSIDGLGYSTTVVIRNSSSSLTLSENFFNFNFRSGSNFNLEKNGFSFVLENGSFFSNSNQLTTLNSLRGFNVFLGAGPLYVEAQRFTFVEKTQHLNQAKPSVVKPSFQIFKGLHVFSGQSARFEYASSLSFKVGTPKLVGGSTAVAWNVTEGDYEVNLTSGELNLNCLDPTSAAFNVKVGPSLLPLSTLTMNTTKFEVNLGPVSPSSLLLNTSKFEVKAGVGNPDTLELGLANFKVEAGSTLLGVKNTLQFSVLSGVTLTAGGLLGEKGKIKLDGDVVITGELIVEDKVYSTDEVYANTVVVLGAPIVATAVALSKHKHATSVPGGPAPPLPG